MLYFLWDYVFGSSHISNVSCNSWLEPLLTYEILKLATLAFNIGNINELNQNLVLLDGVLLKA
jgi:hypothetical protein